MHLSSRFTHPLLLLGVIYLIVVAIAIESIVHAQINLIQKTVSRQNSALAGGIKAQIFERYSDAQALAMNPILSEALRNPAASKLGLAKDLLNSFVRLYLVYSSSLVTDPGGRVVVSGLMNPEAKSLPDFAGIVQAAAVSQEKTHITNLYERSEWPTEQSDDRFQVFTSAITAPSGQVLGYVHNVASTMYVDRELMRARDQFFHSLEVEPQLEVFSESGTLLRRSAGSEVLGDVLSFQDLVDDEKNLSQPTWQVRMQIASNLITGPIRKLGWISHALSVLSFLAVVAGMWWINHNRNAQRREQAAATLEALEKERARISRELHDDVGQNLTALKIYLSRLRAWIPSEQQHHADDMAVIVEETNDVLRKVSMELHPSLLANLGLRDSVQWLVDKMMRTAELQAKVQVQEGFDFSALSKIQEQHLFRLIQEALHNVQKHARARHVRITFSVEKGRNVVRIDDDGQGFGSKKITSGIGMHSMRERAFIMNGNLNVVSPSPVFGTGARVEFTTQQGEASHV